MGWAVGAAIGAWTGAAVGGYSAYVNGGDLSSGLLFGSSIGALTGAIAGQMVPAGFDKLLFMEKVGIAGLAGGTYGVGSGAAQGFAGGKGTVVDILMSAGIGYGIGAATAAGLQAVAPPLSKFAAGLVDRVNINGITWKDIRPLFEYQLHPNGPWVPQPWVKPLYSLATNIGHGMDLNRALFLGGGAALVTGAAFNYQQVLPLISEKCGSDNPCAKGWSF